jgi:DnaJ family protein A protein 2
VTLEDLYNGKETEVPIERHRICGKCNGVGGTDPNAVQTCKGCKGKGMRVMMMQLGPGMYSQRTGPCDDCGGRGQSIDPAKMCKDAPNGEKYTKHGEGDEVPDAEAGDVIIIIQEKKHKIFKRKGADLYMDKEITLIEALTGLDFVLTHLDGRKVRIQNKSGDVIKPESVFTCQGLGMPFHKRTYQTGNLFITFKIKFPTQIDEKSANLLKSALTVAPAAVKGGKKAAASTEEKGEVAEVCELKTYTDAHRNTDHRGGDRDHHESDEDEDEDGHGHGGQRVGCQQQ